MANELARRLRKDMTVDERKLWAELRELRRIGFHFRRQAPLGRYILDFVCYSARVAIEVDGVQHTLPDAKQRDAARDAFLAAEGFKVLRFTNGEVTHSLEGVVVEVMSALGIVERPPDTWADWVPASGPLASSEKPPPLTPPHKGEGDRVRSHK